MGFAALLGVGVGFVLRSLLVSAPLRTMASEPVGLKAATHEAAARWAAAPEANHEFPFGEVARLSQSSGSPRRSVEWLRTRRSVRHDGEDNCARRAEEKLQRVEHDYKQLSRSLGKLRKQLKRLLKTSKNAERRVETLEEQTVATAHFAASPDTSLLRRVQGGEDIDTFDGLYTPDGLLPDDSTFRFWNVSDDTDEEVFKYDRESGQVVLMKNGTYIIYTQVMFHDLGDRCGYSIYVDGTDVARCVAFGSPSPTSGSQRHRDSSAASRTVSHLNFRQCSTQVIRRMDQGSYIYVKGLYQNRTLVATPTLTFWQIAKLG